jgi:mono/diheme cytochrome c family protein
MPRHWQRFTLVAVLTIFLAACAAPTDPPRTEEETQEEVQSEDGVMIEDEPEIEAAAIFAANCARCHGADRSGKNGPALLPERLTQDPSVYEAVITNGSGPMPAFGNRLSSEEISALVEFILSNPQ